VGCASLKIRNNRPHMLYTGIDYHKRYSAVCTVAAEGRRVQSARINQNEPAVFAARLDPSPL